MAKFVSQAGSRSLAVMIAKFEYPVVCLKKFLSNSVIQWYGLSLHLELVFWVQWFLPCIQELRIWQCVSFLALANTHQTAVLGDMGW